MGRQHVGVKGEDGPIESITICRTALVEEDWCASVLWKGVGSAAPFLIEVLTFTSQRL